MRHLMITLMAALTAAALGFVAIAMSTPANADQFDFVSDLDSDGISYPNGSISNMIDLGKAVCHDLRAGTAPNMVVGKLGNVGYSGYEAGTIMGAAANAMCPDTWPVLSVFAHSATSPPANYLPPDYDDGD
jgi:hypothetical protein